MRVTNPLSAELSELRLSLAPGLLGALRFNLNREAAAFHAFEIGKVFSMRDGAPVEHERLAAISYGDYALGAVGQPAVAASFWTLKGVLEQWFIGTGRGVGASGSKRRMKRSIAFCIRAARHGSRLTADRSDIWASCIRRRL